MLIGDYALIGDGRSAALVSRAGSIDWLCWPRFDSPSIFASLLDAESGGYWRVAPRGQASFERRYLSGTNILETTMRTATGTVILRDLMSVWSEAEKRGSLVPEHEILREIEIVTGEVDVEVVYEPRPDYGRRRPLIRPRGGLGLWCEVGGTTLILQHDLSLHVTPDGHGARGVAHLRAGERRVLSLVISKEAPAVIPPLGAPARERLDHARRWWRDWSGRCGYQGPYREAVLRSALALKLMVYAPSGAIIAAPTTSLPERIGGVRNWDYRYCWLRDASLTVRALLDLGYDGEAEALVSWMLHTTRLTWPELQVLYDVFGEAHLPERELRHLAGYANSRPVRVGNDAQRQLQLDVYGEVIDAVARHVAVTGDLDRATSRFLIGLGETVRRRWREPDEGIWEGRAGRHQHTHSKVLCWVALNRLVALAENGLLRSPVERFRTEMEAIRTEIESNGFNRELGSYTRLFNGQDLDGSLLLLPYYGYLDGAHPRLRSTCARIQERLGRGALVYRYLETTADGLPVGEGAFGICSFWLVDCLARGGEIQAAHRAFAELLGYANDVGLYAEEIDPETGAALGNFPQAFTHVGLINAALTLVECEDAARETDRRRRKEQQ